MRTRLWLRWHRRHGPTTVALVNRWPVTVTPDRAASVDRFVIGGVPGQITGTTLHVGVVPLVREYTCPCGKVLTP